jgi:hypothetical protein
MKTCPWEKKMLLEQSGELSARRARRFARHLAGCAACRARRAELNALLAETGRAFAACEPSAAAAAAVRRMAAAHARPRVTAFPRPAVQVLAYAALLTLLLGGWIFNTSLHRDRRRAKLDAALAVVSDTTEDTADGNGDNVPPLRVISEELLRYEGFTDDADALELLNLLGEPTPTAFRERSTPGLA